MRRSTGRIVQALVLSALVGLAGCASGPIADEASVDVLDITPSELADAPEGDAAAPGGGQRVLWGGVILGVTPLESTTELEVLAYPLDRVQRPRAGATAQGRFLLVQPGFLEPLDYSVGRQVTVLGALDGSADATIGEARRRVPRVLAEQLHLWRPGQPGAQPRFSIGIGIGL